MARWVLVAAAAAVLLLAALVGWQLRPSAVLAKRQAALLDGIERGNPGSLRRLVAEDYTDRWDFTREDIVTAMTDAGSQFLALVVTPEDEHFEIEGKRAVVTVRLTLGGRPVGPVGQEVVRQVNRLEEPFVFTWEKESFLPSSWRLVRVENEGLPDDLHDYEPGDIGRAMRGE